MSNNIIYNQNPFHINSTNQKTKMGKTWRKLGLAYIQYSNIAAQTLRTSLKQPELEAAKVRNVTSVTFTKWLNGKPVRERLQKA